MKRSALLLGLCCLSFSHLAQADRERVQGGRYSYQSLSANAHLDFEINIGKFLFFRVGDGSYPAVSSTVNTVDFEVQPSFSLSAGSNQSVNWGGALPGAGVSSGTNILPVEVRSNAGQVSIRATASSALSNGADTLPLSGIVVTSSDSALPAPPIPDMGDGPSVNVMGTQFLNLVTVRQADWTFSYTGDTSVPAGVYTGQITFTASTP
ncbi:MAG: hypothetical protein R3F02_15540 [Thiolinea sp.]